MCVTFNYRIRFSNKILFSITYFWTRGVIGRQFVDVCVLKRHIMPLSVTPFLFVDANYLCDLNYSLNLLYPRAYRVVHQPLCSIAFLHVRMASNILSKSVLPDISVYSNHINSVRHSLLHFWQAITDFQNACVVGIDVSLKDPHGLGCVICFWTSFTIYLWLMAVVCIYKSFAILRNLFYLCEVRGQTEWGSYYCDVVIFPLHG